MRRSTAAGLTPSISDVGILVWASRCEVSWCEASWCEASWCRHMSLYMSSLNVSGVDEALVERIPQFPATACVSKLSGQGRVEPVLEQSGLCRNVIFLKRRRAISICVSGIHLGPRPRMYWRNSGESGRSGSARPFSLLARIFDRNSHQGKSAPWIDVRASLDGRRTPWTERVRYTFIEELLKSCQ